MPLEHIYQIAHKGNDAIFLRQEFIKRGSVENMVDSALQRFRNNEP